MGDRPDSGVLTWVKAHAGHAADECLIWPFARTRQGYGTAYFRGKSILAHRMMCVVAHGDPPAVGLDAAHSCGRGHAGCVNPRHLRWDTRAGNCSDKLAHGTDARGEKSPVAKLTQGQVDEIRRLRGVVTQRELARRFGIDQSNVSKIQRGHSWSYA